MKLEKKRIKQINKDAIKSYKNDTLDGFITLNTRVNSDRHNVYAVYGEKPEHFIQALREVADTIEDIIEEKRAQDKDDKNENK